MGNLGRREIQPVRTKKSIAGFPVDRKWALGLERFNVDVIQVLRQAGLPDDLFHQPGASLSTEEFFGLWESFAANVEDPAFPITLVESMSVERFDPPLFAAYCSPNFETALQRLSKFKALICPMRLELRQSSDTTEVAPVFTESTLTPPSALIAFELAIFVQLARMGTRETIQPLQVLSPVEFDAEDRYCEFFGVRPERADRMGLVFSSDTVALPFVAANSNLWSLFEPGMLQRLSELDNEASLANRVRAVLMKLLPGGDSSMALVASKLAMSKRTLQRRLSQEGTSFQVELGRVREELAQHYLANTDLTNIQISYLLGFDDPSSFFRAFHTWTGTSPERARSEFTH